jgi:hypothetical protein
MMPKSLLLLVVAAVSTRLALAQESNSTGSGIYGGGELLAGEWFGVTPFICAEGCYTPSNVY